MSAVPGIGRSPEQGVETIMTKNISAVLVATRIQRRLKNPIPMLPFGEKTILRQTIDAYLEAGIGEIAVVVGYRGSEIQESLRSLPGSVKVVISPDPEEPFNSMFRRGLQALSAPKGVAVGMGDQALLPGELIARLAAAFSAGKSRILVPVWSGQVGMPVFLQTQLAEELAKMPAGSEIWDLLTTHKEDIGEYPTSHISVLRHIEDMEDYHRMLEMAGHALPQPVEENAAAAAPQREETPADTASTEL